MFHFFKHVIFSIIAIIGVFVSGPSMGWCVDKTSAETQFESPWSFYEAGRYDKACKIWQIVADQGDEIAQINLGAMYDNGLGVSEDAAIAAKWYRLAAISGNPYAQYNLGCMYVEGRGVERDLIQAKDWYLKAAERNLPMAQFSLGMLYAEQSSKSNNKNENFLNHREEAIQWFYKSGLSYLKSDEIDNALTSLKAIEEIENAHVLKQQLLSKIQNNIAKPKINIPEILAQGSAIGTAWPIASGYVVTNNHVVANSDEVVLIDVYGQKINAWAVIRDEANDIAFLEVTNIQELPPALPLSSETTELGSKVFTIGFPRIDALGVSPKCTEGIINGLEGINENPYIYQTTVPIQPGNSGGPLLNMKGEVVGVIRSQIGYRSDDQNTIDVLENASCAIKIAGVKDLFAYVTQNKAPLQTLPCQPESVEKLFSRLRNSMLIVVAQ